MCTWPARAGKSEDVQCNVITGQYNWKRCPLMSDKASANLTLCCILQMHLSLSSRVSCKRNTNLKFNLDNVYK